MSKRQFRAEVVAPAQTDPDYPTLETFEGSRRSFLSRLGLAFVGAGAVGLGLSACGRPVGETEEPDFGHAAGGAPMPDAGADVIRPSVPDSRLAPDTRTLRPDARTLRPDARTDKPDAGQHEDWGNIAGGAPMPPSKVDTGPPKPDLAKPNPGIGGTDGDAPMPDARID